MEDVFPTKHGDIPASYVIVYQRVTSGKTFIETSKHRTLRYLGAKNIPIKHRSPQEVLGCLGKLLRVAWEPTFPSFLRVIQL